MGTRTSIYSLSGGDGDDKNLIHIMFGYKDGDEVFL